MEIQDKLKIYWENLVGITELKKQHLIELNNLIYKMKITDSLLYNCSKTDEDKATKIVNLESRISILLTQIANLNMEIQKGQQTIESLKYQLAKDAEIPTICPSWLDETKPAYKPYLQIPKTNEGYVLNDPRDIYLQGNMLERYINANENRKLSKYQKLLIVWRFTIDALTYTSDVGDNWQPHIDTIARRKGDCEDGTILFIDSCRMLGISAGEVFNAVGPTNFDYHSYPIVWLSEEDVRGTQLEGKGDKWFIFETTLDYYPDVPLRLKGSVYWVDDTANWKYSGTIKNNMLLEFNGSSGGGVVRGEEIKEIKHGKKKRNSINKYWKEVVSDGKKDK